LLVLENVGIAPDDALREVETSSARPTLQVRRFAVDGLSIAAIVEPGPRRPVVFLHGNSSTKDVWSNQLDFARRQGRAVLAPDLPGHGESENAAAPSLTYSLPGYARIVSGLLDALRWDGPIDLVGWSLGGHIGLELLAADPRIGALLIVGTPPARPAAESLERAFYSSEDMRLAAKEDFTEAEALAYGTAMMGGREYLTPLLLRNLVRTHGEARRCLFASVVNCIGSDQRLTVESISKPLCVIHGENEPFVRLDYLLSLNYRSLWNDRIYVISGAGHAPHWQTPAIFNGIMAAFLRFAETHSTMASAV
jgi:pimeloyl-ACP methyl ester carboxylesterase